MNEWYGIFFRVAFGRVWAFCWIAIGFLIGFDSFYICSDELLNYEIGDVEADDTVLTGADEDELLLSDDGNFEILDFHSHKLKLNFSIKFVHLSIFVPRTHTESISGKLSKEQEEDLLSERAAPVSSSSSSSTPQKSNESSKDRVVPTTPSTRSTSKRHASARKVAVVHEAVKVAAPSATKAICDTTEAVPTKHTEKESVQSECETIKPDISADGASQSEPSNFDSQQSSSSQPNPDLSDTENSDNNRSEATKPSPLPSSSQLTSTESASEYDASAISEINDFEAEDSDESSEHQNRNRKLCVEREQSNQSDELSRPQQQQQQHGAYFQRNRGGSHFANSNNNNNNNNRHSAPRQHHPYRMPMGENFGLPFMHQFGQPNRHPGNQLRPPFNRMPMQGAISYQRVPPPPPPSAMMQQSHGMPPAHRMQRPMCPPSQSGMFFPLWSRTKGEDRNRH